MTCGRVENESHWHHPENVQLCGKDALVPLTLPSGLVVAHLCVEHAYLAQV